MEEKTTENPIKSPSQPPTGRFMDIQNTGDGQAAPVTIETTEAEVSATPVNEDVAISPEGQLSELPTPPTSPEQQTGEPQAAATNIAVSDGSVADAPAETPLVEEGQMQSSEQSDEKPAEPEHPQMPHKSSGAPVAAIVIAIIVALALCGLVVFAFFKAKNDTKLGGDTSSSNSQTTVTKPQASPTDVDQTTSSIDQSLNSANDATDFSATDISDQSLGL